MSSTIALPRHRGPGAGQGGPWRVIVRNDAHNTFDHVAASLSTVLPGVTLQHGYKFADRIHRRGFAVVWSGHRELAEHYWEALRALGLTMAPLEQG